MVKCNGQKEKLFFLIFAMMAFLLLLCESLRWVVLAADVTPPNTPRRSACGSSFAEDPHSLPSIFSNQNPTRV